MSATARPTWTPAMGGRSIRDKATHPVTQYSVYDLASHTTLKVRQPGQNTEEEIRSKNLKAELEQAEDDYRARMKEVRRKRGLMDKEEGEQDDKESSESEAEDQVKDEDDEDVAAKRRRVLEESRKVDMDNSSSESDASGSSSSSEEEDSSSDDDDDDTAELLIELERIKKEKAAEKEHQERIRAEEEARERENEIMTGNPLLAPGFNVKRRWDEDVVFKKQASGLEDKAQKRFVNDILRSDFHKKFMHKYLK